MSGVEVVESQAKFDDSRIQWREAKFAKGATYQIGRLEDGGPTLDVKGVTPDVVTSLTKDCHVNWEVGADEWKDTTQDVKDTVYITRYNLYRNHGGIVYVYALVITNTQQYLTYHFTDDEDDVYALYCSQNGDHILKYNSWKPRIKHVRSDE